MKFKITVISFLTAILAVCLFTSYTLISTTQKQLDLQKIHLEIELEQYELENGTKYYNGIKGSGEWCNDAYYTLESWWQEISKIYEGK